MTPAIASPAPRARVNRLSAADIAAQTQARERAERRKAALKTLRHYMRRLAVSRRTNNEHRGMHWGVAHGALQMARATVLGDDDYYRLNKRLDRVWDAKITRGRPQQ